jgi:hypothetical protein
MVDAEHPELESGPVGAEMISFGQNVLLELSSGLRPSVNVVFTSGRRRGRTFGNMIELGFTAPMIRLIDFGSLMISFTERSVAHVTQSGITPEQVREDYWNNVDLTLTRAEYGESINLHRYASLDIGVNSENLIFTNVPTFFARAAYDTGVFGEVYNCWGRRIRFSVLDDNDSWIYQIVKCAPTKHYFSDEVFANGPPMLGDGEIESYYEILNPGGCPRFDMTTGTKDKEEVVWLIDHIVGRRSTDDNWIEPVKGYTTITCPGEAGLRLANGEAYLAMERQMTYDEIAYVNRTLTRRERDARIALSRMRYNTYYAVCHPCIDYEEDTLMMET